MRGDLVELVMELHDMGQSKLSTHNVSNLLCDSGPARKLHEQPWCSGLNVNIGPMYWH